LPQNLKHAKIKTVKKPPNIDPNLLVKFTLMLAGQAFVFVHADGWTSRAGLGPTGPVFGAIHLQAA